MTKKILSFADQAGARLLEILFWSVFVALMVVVALPLFLLAMALLFMVILLQDLFKGIKHDRFNPIRGKLSYVFFPKPSSNTRDRRPQQFFSNPHNSSALIYHWEDKGSALWRHAMSKSIPINPFFLDFVHRQNPSVAREMLLSAAETDCGIKLLAFQNADAIPDEMWVPTLLGHASRNGCLTLREITEMSKHGSRVPSAWLTLLLPYRSRHLSKHRLAVYLENTFHMTMHEIIPLLEIPRTEGVK